MKSARRPYKKNVGTRRMNYRSNRNDHANIVLTFLEMLNTIKLYHWKTHIFSQHKATDELYSNLNTNIDKFVEIMLGKDGSRVQLTNVRHIPLNDYNDSKSFKRKVEEYKQFLINMSPNLTISANSDLMNVRDELLGDLNQFTYLLTFE